ncbi:MAG TPA: DMT family transporter [Myxococcales bacterium]|nr:DMT family transporter [Myxococcales bacterium]
MSEATAQASGRTIVARGAIGAAAAILYVFIWATAFVPSRVLARDTPPLWILTIRFGVAGGILLLLAAALRLRIPRDADSWVRLFALGLGGNALYLGLNYLALKHLSAGMGSIIASTNPLILAVLAPWLLREPLTARKVTGLVLGFGGVVLAMHARAGTQTARLPDVLLAVSGVVAFVFSNILYKRMRDRPHPLVLNGAQLLCASAAVCLGALLLEGPPAIVWTPPVVWSLLYLIVILSVGASMLWFWILQHGEASRVSAYFFLTPAFGLLLAAALLGEQLTATDGIALLVIATGLWLVAHEPSRGLSAGRQGTLASRSS